MTLARRTPGYRSTDAHYPKECSIFGGLRDQGRSSPKPDFAMTRGPSTREIRSGGRSALRGMFAPARERGGVWTARKRLAGLGLTSRAGLNILTSCSRRRFLRLKIAAWRCELETLIAGCDVSPAYRHLRSWTGLARIRLRLRALSALSRAQRGLA